MSAGIKVPKSPPGHSNGVMPKVVGPNVQGNREEYQLVRRLQSALFGGVYEAKGLTSNRDFAIKVLHKSELTKAQESSSIEFCEVPLSEIRFADLMRGHEHVMEAEEHFEDAYCFYVVFELARGGDLLEALKQKPHGFDEAHAQFLIKQAARGLAFLHDRRVAMQDVSLENMLLHVQESTGFYQVKICDPGQAVIFELDQNGEEMPVNFRGLVGKSFRPPELHDQVSYCATKVDSWCLGWSTFYLLTAQPLFMSADPAQQDSDWLLFQQGDFATLFQQKSNLCSPTGLDFIFRMLQIEPRRRMSITDALNHKWLADPSLAPVLAPKDVLPELVDESGRPLETVDGVEDNKAQLSPVMVQNNIEGSGGGSPVGTSENVQGYQTSNELPTWAATAQGPFAGASGYPQYSGSMTQQFATPVLRVRSPPRSPRSPRTNAGPRLTFDRLPFDRFGASATERDGRPRYPNPARMAHMVATAHSPVPASSYTRQGGASPPPRTVSPGPLQSSITSIPPTYMRAVSPEGQHYYESNRPAMLTPRSGSGRPPPAMASMQASSIDGEDRTRGRAWAFRSESPEPIRTQVSGDLDPFGRPRAPSPFGHTSGASSPPRTQAGSGSWTVQGSSSRAGQSPSRNQGTSITFPRSISPGYTEVRASGGGSLIRAPSPAGSIVAPGAGARSSDGIGFNWSTAAPPLSPRAAPVSRIASPTTGVTPASVSRIASPLAGTAVTRIASPSAKVQTFKPPSAGFAWSPEPPSPRASPRSYSPGPVALGQSVKAIPAQSNQLRWAP